MKHNIPMTLLLLTMFIVTQLIGLYVIYSDPFNIKTEVNGETQIVENPALTFIEPPEIKQESDFGFYFTSIIIAFIFSIIILFLLTKFKIDFILKIWFFSVVAIALDLSFTAIFPESIYLISPLFYFILPALIAIPLAFVKIFRRNFIVHNFTELLIYPGIATIFVAILNFWSILVLLLLISLYDIWAVWHSGIMQKMAKYQINNLKIFSGFFIPYLGKKEKELVAQAKMLKSQKKLRKIKVNVAILGGGDIVFPIILAGIVMHF